MDLELPPPWSGNQLKRLGKAIVDLRSSSEGHPAYTDVMEWHAELSEEVSAQIADRSWSSFNGEFDVSSRAKTIDTLREKLMRETSMKLNQVQDLAGVRVDLDGHLGEQTAFCDELASFFGGDLRAEIKDIRQRPHSGYRAVHVWLRLPAGRVEIQVRTRHQSAWANAYERLGDLFGRQIRYGDPGEGPTEQIVAKMHSLSTKLRANEERHLRYLEAQAGVTNLERIIERELLNADEAVDERLREQQQDARLQRETIEELQATTEEGLTTFLEGMNALARSLDEIEQVEVGE